MAIYRCGLRALRARERFTPELWPTFSSLSSCLIAIQSNFVFPRKSRCQTKTKSPRLLTTAESRSTARCARRPAGPHRFPAARPPRQTVIFKMRAMTSQNFVIAFHNINFRPKNRAEPSANLLFEVGKRAGYSHMHALDCITRPFHFPRVLIYRSAALMRGSSLE